MSSSLAALASLLLVAAPTPADLEPADSGPPRAAPAKGEAQAPTPEGVETDRVRSVQRKELYKRGRLSITPQGSVSINDPFFTKAGGSLALAYHLTDAVGVGLRGGLLRALPAQDLQTARANVETAILADPPAWLAMAELEWSPLYGKLALGDSIHHFDGYLFAGGGVVATRTRNMAFEAGLGFRFGATSWLALNLSLQQTLYSSAPAGGTVAILQSLVSVNAGLTLFLPFRPAHLERT